MGMKKIGDWVGWLIVVLICVVITIAILTFCGITPSGVK